MKGPALRLWRVRMRLTQEQAVLLYGGCCSRQWRRYESGDSVIPTPLTHWMRLWEFFDKDVVEVPVKKRIR